MPSRITDNSQLRLTKGTNWPGILGSAVGMRLAYLPGKWLWPLLLVEAVVIAVIIRSDLARRRRRP